MNLVVFVVDYDYDLIFWLLALTGPVQYTVKFQRSLRKREGKREREKHSNILIYFHYVP